MSTITFDNGMKVNFNGTPTQQDIEEVAGQLGLGAAPATSSHTLHEAPALSPIQDIADTTKRGLGAGIKAAGNLPSSAADFAKNIVKTVAHPIDTAKNVGLAATGALDALAGKITGKPIPTTFGNGNANETTNAFHSIAGALKDRYGSLENLQHTATTDPFGFSADVLSVISGGAGVAGKTAELGSAISKTSKLATTPAKAIASNVAKKTSATASFATSNLTGLEHSTISTALEQSQALSAAQKAGLNRATLGIDLQSTIDARVSHLSDLGKGYEPIRTMQLPVMLPKDWLATILNKHNIEIGPNGKIATTKESTVLNPTDVQALQHFHDLYAKDPLHTPNSYLNTRDALTQLSKFDAAKTGNLQSIARDARAELNRYRNQVPNLEHLDNLYSPEVQELKQIKKEWINPQTGELKDNVLSQIANAANDSKGGANPVVNAKLARLEAVQPGITHQIKLVRAIEDIEKASGIKVGTYSRVGTVTGLGLTGNVPAAIVTAILTSPEVAVPLIKGLGWTKTKIAPLLQALKEAGGNVNNFRLPAPQLPAVK
jgi:hypothetical protein